MKGLIALFRMRLSVGLQYRAAAFAGVFTQIFFGLVMVMTYTAFFDSTTLEMPMTLPQTITYIWLGQGMFSLIPWSPDREVQQMIRQGDVAYEFVRPLNLYWYWFFRITAVRLSAFILRSVPLFIFAGFLLPEGMAMGRPQDMGHFIAFVLTMVGAVILGSASCNMATISTLFTIGDGMDRFYPAVITFFSGLTIPLAFFPDWLQPFMTFQPFSGLMDTPYKLYLGIYDAGMVYRLLGHQLLWTVTFVVMGQWMLKRASKRIVVQGG